MGPDRQCSRGKSPVRQLSLQTLREWIWLALGAAGAINELFLQHGPQYPRPYALAFSATLLGIPALLSWDRSKRDKDS